METLSANKLFSTKLSGKEYQFNPINIYTQFVLLPDFQSELELQGLNPKKSEFQLKSTLYILFNCCVEKDSWESFEKFYDWAVFNSNITSLELSEAISLVNNLHEYSNPKVPEAEKKSLLKRLARLTGRMCIYGCAGLGLVYLYENFITSLLSRFIS
jgi:hypothetical protein